MSKWNVSEVRTMGRMFAGCKKFNSDLSGWNISNVDNMRNMFLDCDSFSFNLKGWNLNKNINLDCHLMRLRLK